MMRVKTKPCRNQSRSADGFLSVAAAVRPSLGDEPADDPWVALYVRAFPASSTAAQNRDEGHETLMRLPILSISAGELHDLPLNIGCVSRAYGHAEVGAGA